MDEIIDKPDNTLKNEGEKLLTVKELKAMREDVRTTTQLALETHGDRNIVFHEMLEKYGSKHQKLIGQDVAYEISKKELSPKKLWFYILLILQTAVIVLAILEILPRMENGMGIAAYLFGIFYFIILLWVVKSLFQFKGVVLSSVLFLSLIRLFGSILTLINQNIQSFDYAQIAIAIPSIGIAFYLRKILLPHLGFFGPRKNESGQVRF